METKFSHLQEVVAGVLAVYGLKALGAVAIIVIARIAGGFFSGMVGKALRRARIDETVATFASNCLYWSILCVAGVAALSNFGVQTASLVAIFGTISLAVGLALQASLSNFASGVMLLIFRPFRVGDFIEAAGVGGTVQEIEVFTTILKSKENVKIIVPNSKLYSDVIKNHSAYGQGKDEVAPV